MRPPSTSIAVALFLAAAEASLARQPWAYQVNVPRENQQANFCTNAKDVLELARIFERFGAPTGFSALSSSPGCALETHSLVPKELIKQVKIKLESGDHYDVNFIRVHVEGDVELYLVTTRRLVGRD